MVEKGQAIIVEGLHYSYSKVKALDGISLSVPYGTVFALIGPNGAGKTTLVKILLGALKPKSGRVTVLGRDPRDIEAKAKIGFLPERVNLPGDWSALKFMSYIGYLCRLSRREARERSLDLLRWMGLEENAEDLIKSFSAGMKQRLLIAQSLINDPELLIYDEPTSNLDALGRHEVLEKIRELKEEGKTVFLSGHVLSEVEKVSDYVVIMSHGRVILEGELEKLKTRGLTNTFELKTNDLQRTEELLSGLNSVINIMRVRDHLEVEVKDSSQASKEIPRVLVEAGLELLRFNRVKRSLEEIFLKLLEEEEKR
ncbi:ABC transporter ATP-binding protein [Candidatus Bathyarchaeota archaeon]|nr:MAG: ABC transporter ATP-binding protein [Candidatus Bathyarchaeota archaeon]RLG31322.1 MAG: ABC transporter ATP-binding protein [Methanosarcinales archaeon]RLI33780.1 MAG: ABC transporter ATP-binding protein [Candidatus Bathyarchaeota archaeon]